MVLTLVPHSFLLPLRITLESSINTCEQVQKGYQLVSLLREVQQLVMLSTLLGVCSG